MPFISAKQFYSSDINMYSNRSGWVGLVHPALPLTDGRGCMSNQTLNPELPGAEPKSQQVTGKLTITELYRAHVHSCRGLQGVLSTERASFPQDLPAGCRSGYWTR